jgi:hypothetical protein
MRGALASSSLMLWRPAVPALSVAVAFGLVSSVQTKFLVLVAIATAVVLALSLPPHAFLAGSLALLAMFQLSADHPVSVGGIAVYTSDLLLALVALRALTSRPRREVSWRIFDVATGAAVLAWGLVMVIAAVRGHLAGTSAKSLVRLDEQLFYYPILGWGFLRVLRERDVSSARLLRALAGTGLVFVGYMAFERLTHQRFENPNSTSGHLGSVVTAQGVTLHRDYGFYSAYDLYGLAAVGAIAYLLFARRTRGAIVAIAVIFLAATVLTLVRGIVFGSIAGVALLMMLALRSDLRHRLQGPRLLALSGFVAVGIALFWTSSPATARGVAERFLPGIAAQSQAAVQTARYRQKALTFGYRQANARPVGTGFAFRGSASQRAADEGYLAHSAWATILVYTGWLGLAAFLSSVFLLVRRSFQLPDASGWLKPFFVAALALLLIEGFGSDSIVKQPWVLGEAALLIGLRFGLADLDDHHDS